MTDSTKPLNDLIAGIFANAYDLQDILTDFEQPNYTLGEVPQTIADLSDRAMLIVRLVYDLKILAKENPSILIRAMR